MCKFFTAVGAMTIACAGATAIALSATSVTPQQTIHAMLGSWTCVTHDANEVWREIAHDSLYGKWLRRDVTYPAQNGEAAATAVDFFGYDGKHHRWILMVVNASGGYGVMYSTSPSFNGSRWTGGYPATSGSTTVTMPNAHEFTLDSTGRMGSSRQECSRS